MTSDLHIWNSSISFLLLKSFSVPSNEQLPSKVTLEWGQELLTQADPVPGVGCGLTGASEMPGILINNDLIPKLKVISLNNFFER